MDANQAQPGGVEMAGATRLLKPAALSGVLLAGCASTSDQAARRVAEHRSAQSCVRLLPQAQQHRDGLVDPRRYHGDTPAVAGFSAQAVATALGIGVLPPLMQFAALPGADAAVSNTVRLQSLYARQRLGDRVLLALLDVQGRGGRA